MTPGSVIVASVGSGAQLPHTYVANHPEVLHPDNCDSSGCHLSSFLCLSEDYQVAVQAGTAPGHAGEMRWDTIQLQRGGMLLMVATSRHHVPFVNRPFESEIHGTVNFTQFCCVLLVTWCYHVLLSCYLRPK